MHKLLPPDLFSGLLAISADSDRARQLAGRDRAGAALLTASRDDVSADGVVRYVPIEGGFYAIQSVDGRNFDPTNLPEEFRHDGVAVRFSAVIRPDLMSTRQYGQLIEITKITAR